jgi:hypothetical protein
MVWRGRWGAGVVGCGDRKGYSRRYIRGKRFKQTLECGTQNFPRLAKPIMDSLKVERESWGIVLIVRRDVGTMRV